MNRFISLAFGLVILAIPMMLVGSAVITAVAALPLIPMALPMTTLCLLGAVAVAWVRWQRRVQRDTTDPANGYQN